MKDEEYFKDWNKRKYDCRHCKLTCNKKFCVKGEDKVELCSNCFILWKQAQKELINKQRKRLEELRKTKAGLSIINIFLMEWEEELGLIKPIREQLKGEKQ